MLLGDAVVPWDRQATVATTTKDVFGDQSPQPPTSDQEMRKCGICCSPTRWSAVSIEVCRNLDLSPGPVALELLDR